MQSVKGKISMSLLSHCTLTKCYNMRLEVFIVVKIGIVVFQVKTPHSLVHTYHRNLTIPYSGEHVPLDTES